MKSSITPNKIKGKAVWKGQQFGGYPGVKHTAKLIMQYAPTKLYHIEPFAGLGRTSEYVKKGQLILNDKSPVAIKYLKENFKDAIITEVDYMECIKKWDGVDSFFLIDPPWITTVYEKNSLTFCDRKAQDYYDELLEILPKIKGDWILLSNVNGVGATRMRRTKYNIIEVTSERKILFGNHARTLLMSNNKFIKHEDNQGIDVFF